MLGHTFPLIEVSGSAYEMGYQHGSQAAYLIQPRLRERWGSVTVEGMKEILAYHQGHPAAICRHGAVGMHSISGYIAEPKAGLLHVRRGHGCLGSWTAYEV